MGSPLTKLDLVTIEAEDILASRVFNEGVPDGPGEAAAQTQPG